MITKQLIEKILGFMWDKKYCIIAIIVSIFLYHKLFFPEITERTVEVEKIVNVIVHDTVTIEKQIPITKIVYVKDTTFISDSTKLEQIDSLYKEFANQIKNGNIPTVTDTNTFSTGDFIRVKYHFPPKNSFVYDFKAANDTTITEKITEKIYIKQKDNLSLYFGSKYNKYNDKFYPSVGLKIFNLGVDYTYEKNNDLIGLNYFLKIKF